MLEAILLDNDVVLKMCSYASSEQLLRVTTLEDQPPAILRVASYSLRSQVKRSRRIVDHQAAAAELAAVLAVAQLLEPADHEITYAADLEERALQDGLELDPGESLLAAILLHRLGPLLLTGDKRALAALAAVAPEAAHGRLACLEQVVISIIDDDDQFAGLRAGVCLAKAADTAVTNSFACYSDDVTREQAIEGLRSYLGALRAQAGPLLITSDDLLAITPQEDRIGLV